LSRPLYSQVVIDQHSSSDLSASYLVPAGYVFIVRDMVAFSSTTTSTGGVVVQSSGSGAFLWYVGTPAGATETLQWQGRQVIEGGDTVTCDVYGAAGTSIRVSGYLLSS
jgi:hypothetical protein